MREVLDSVLDSVPSVCTTRINQKNIGLIFLFYVTLQTTLSCTLSRIREKFNKFWHHNLSQSLSNNGKGCIQRSRNIWSKKSPDGYRIILMDKLYTSPTLLANILFHYNMGVIGTVRKNRKRIYKEVVTMKKNEERG